MQGPAIASALALAAVVNFSALAQVSLHAAIPGLRVRITPPPARLEVRPLAPTPDHHGIPDYWAWRGGTRVWIGGDWHWDSYRHVWIAGRWSAPWLGHVWVSGRWAQGPKGRWHPYPGHWRR